MMYQVLDGLIVDSIKSKKEAKFAELMEGAVLVEVKRIAEACGREDFRVLDGRLTRLEKRGVIEHYCRNWRVV